MFKILLKRYLACLLVLLIMLGLVLYYNQQAKTARIQLAEQSSQLKPAQTYTFNISREAPKYVFLFIGDGMSYPQLQATSDYLGALEDPDYLQARPSLGDNQGATLDGPKYLNFMNFKSTGSAVNFDSNSFAPDSASSATSISTGNKTYAGSINVDTTGLVPFETITEKLHEQLGMRVGIVSSVHLNHATPAAFYAHNVSRNNYYEIGLELAASDFEYFAGASFLNPDGYDTANPSENLYDVAKNAGYKICRTNEEIASISQEDGKVIVVAEKMPYEIDRAKGIRPLASYVQKGIEFLDNGNGFFMMCEGGAIDWAGHANDAATVIHETRALADAVQVAIDFAQLHPEETLIIVTGDHETGGMSIGFAGTNHDTYLTLLENQKMSFGRFDSLIAAYRRNKTPFSEVMRDIEKYFGLKAYDAPGNLLALTEYELKLLRTAYEKSVLGEKTGMYPQQEYVMYGSYEPLSVAVTSILNNKAGLSFTTFSHTGLPVAVFAHGKYADDFEGYYDNTEIFHKLKDIMNVQ